MWADVIDNRYVSFRQLARKSQIEIRKINQDGDVWTTTLDFPNHLVEQTIDTWQVADDLGQSNHRNLMRIDNEIAPCIAHGIPANSEELDVVAIVSLAHLLPQGVD